jgi:hypothetical protein
MIQIIKNMLNQDNSSLALKTLELLDNWESGKGNRTEFLESLTKWVNVTDLDNLTVNDIYYWLKNAPKGEWSVDLEDTYRFLYEFIPDPNPTKEQIKTAIHGALYCVGQILNTEQNKYALDNYKKIASDLWNLQQL